MEERLGQASEALCLTFLQEQPPTRSSERSPWAMGAEAGCSDSREGEAGQVSSRLLPEPGRPFGAQLFSVAAAPAQRPAQDPASAPPSPFVRRAPPFCRLRNRVLSLCTCSEALPSLPSGEEGGSLAGAPL